MYNFGFLRTEPMRKRRKTQRKPSTKVGEGKKKTKRQYSRDPTQVEIRFIKALSKKRGEQLKLVNVFITPKRGKIYMTETGKYETIYFNESGRKVSEPPDIYGF